MKIIDAVWERRNLGCAVVEIELAEGDTLEALSAAEQRLAPDVRCVTAKTPVGRSDLLFGLSRLGWTFVEAQESVRLRRRDCRVPKSPARFDAQGSWRLAETDTDAQRALAPFLCGSFATDRIALDPAFGEAAAGRRYHNWSLDVFRGGGEIFECLFRDRVIGSFVFQPDPVNKRVNRAILGAMLPEFQNKGLGALFFKKNMDAAFDRGYDEIQTKISSNNTAIFRLWQTFGAELLETRYVYVKHR